MHAEQQPRSHELLVSLATQLNVTGAANKRVAQFHLEAQESRYSPKDYVQAVVNCCRDVLLLFAEGYLVSAYASLNGYSATLDRATEKFVDQVGSLFTEWPEQPRQSVVEQIRRELQSESLRMKEVADQLISVSVDWRDYERRLTARNEQLLAELNGGAGYSRKGITGFEEWEKSLNTAVARGSLTQSKVRDIIRGRSEFNDLVANLDSNLFSEVSMQNSLEDRIKQLKTYCRDRFLLFTSTFADGLSLLTPAMMRPATVLLGYRAFLELNREVISDYVERVLSQWPSDKKTDIASSINCLLMAEQIRSYRQAERRVEEGLPAFAEPKRDKQPLVDSVRNEQKAVNRSKWVPDRRKVIEDHEKRCADRKLFTISKMFRDLRIKPQNGYAALRGKRETEWPKIKAYCQPKSPNQKI